MHWKGLFTVLENADKAIKIINISITKIEETNIIFDQFMRSLWTRASNLYSITFNHTMLWGKGLLSLSKLLVNLCSVLQTLDLSYNRIDDDINVTTCFLRAYALVWIGIAFAWCTVIWERIQKSFQLSFSWKSNILISATTSLIRWGRPRVENREQHTHRIFEPWQ